MYNHNMKNIGKTTLFFLTCLATGLILLFAVFLLPTDPMKSNLNYSRIAISLENGRSGEILFGDPSSFDSLFTDCIMLLSAVYNPDHSIGQQVAAVYRPELDEEIWKPAEALVDYLNDGRVDLEVSYSRYWHGYLVVLKPLLMLLSFEEIKLLNLLVQGILFLWLFAAMREKGLKNLSLALAAAYFLMFPAAMGLSLSMAICNFILLAGMAILIRHPRLATETVPALWFFMGLGIATAYFDFLTFPLVTLGYPLVLALALRKDSAKNLRFVLTSCLAWGASYGLFWGCKWILGSLLLGENIITDAIQTIFFRTSSQGGSSRLVFYFQTLYRNLWSWKALPYLVLLGILVICFLRGLFSQRKKGSPKDLLPYLAVALLPFLWYAVILNHSYEHAAYTFRILTISVFAGLAGVYRAR